MIKFEDREHQKEAFSFVMDLFKQDIKYFALFMEQGTGKSRVIVNIAKYLYKQGAIDTILLVATNASKEQWGEEQLPIHYEEVNELSIFIWDGCKTKKSKNKFFKVADSENKLKVFIFNIEAYTSNSVDTYVKYIISKGNGGFVVVDESTKIKNGRRKPGRGKRGGALRTNRILDYFSNKNCYKAILTGTPTPKSPFDLWSQFEFLKTNYFNMDYFFFTHRYGIQMKRSNGGKNFNTLIDEKTFNQIKYKLKKADIITPMLIEELSARFSTNTENVLKINKMDKYYQYKNLKELKSKIDKVTFFKKKVDCLDIPPKTYEILKVEMSKEQKRIYTNLKDQLYSTYGGQELSVTNKISLYVRLQAVTGGLFPYTELEIKKDLLDEEYFEKISKFKYIEPNPKIKTLLDDLEEVPDYTYGIIWARFRAEIELIENKLLENNYTCQKFYGGSENSVIDEFKKGNFQWLVATPTKGSEALNLQIATIQYFYSNSFKADDRLQAEDRSHRDGQENKVLYKDLICKNTVDERIFAVLKRKENLIDYFRGKTLEDIL